MKKIFIGRDNLETHFVRGLLEAEGILAQVLGEPLEMARGDLPFTTGSLPAVWVNGSDLPLAREIIADYEHKKRFGPHPDSPAESWTCPTCGESLEPQFTQCWNCQARRPDFNIER